MHPRIIRERKTIAAMSKIYCKDHHGLPYGELCQECMELLNYAFYRLEKCPYQEKKPTCANCPIHCYKPEMRERVKNMMRYSGPRMLIHHPVLAIAHLLDGRKKVNSPGKMKSKREQAL